MPRAPFLQLVAAHYLHEDLDRYCFVFPSKRALSFFRHYLGALSADRPLFAPEMRTMSELFGQLVPECKVLDKTAQLFELYEAYRDVRRAEEVESFDDFIYWGNVILQDFDLLDRYLVKIGELYRNIRDLKALEPNFFDYWDDETEEHTIQELRKLCEEFWNVFGDSAQRDPGQDDEAQARFLRFWDCLAPLYERFFARLEAQGYTTDGHRYRLANQGLEDRLDKLSSQREYIFVGLFTLPRGEQRVLRYLAQSGRASFCWDRRVRIIEDEEHPASRYLKRIARHIGREVEGGWNDSSLPTLPRTIQKLITPSRIAEAKVLPDLLQSELGIDPSSRALYAAVILPDEGQLLPVANALPKSLEHINITMGFPLKYTPVALFLKRWMQLHVYASERQGAEYYPADKLLSIIGLRLVDQIAPQLAPLIKVLRRGRYHIGLKRFFELADQHVTAEGREGAIELLHLLLDRVPSAQQLLERMQQLLELLRQGISWDEDADELESSEELAAPATEQAQSSDVRQAARELERTKQRQAGFDLEFVYHYQRLLTRLGDLVGHYGTSLSVATAVHLIEGLVELVSIPFEGDPLQGTQIMGQMEARGIQLPRVVYLSAQDDVLPRDPYTASLIPVSLRRAFGLPTGSADEPGGDYTFFQTIACADQLVFVASPSDPMGTGSEESRYIKLLEYVYGQRIDRLQLELDSRRYKAPEIRQPKTPEIMEQLSHYLGEGHTAPRKYLAPTRLLRYMNCSLAFYYSVVCEMYKDEEPELLMRNNDFGTVYHDTMEQLYEKRRGYVLHGTDFKQAKDEIPKLLETAYLKTQHRLRSFAEVTPAMRHGLSPLDHMYIDMLKLYVEKTLEVDRACPELQIESGEEEVRITYKFTHKGRQYLVGLKGTIDRIDRCCAASPKEDEAGSSQLPVTRVLDYKTGQDKFKLAGAGIESLRDKHNKAIFQTLFYCLLVLQDKGGKYEATKLYPVIYALRGPDGLMRQTTSYKGLVQGLDKLLLEPEPGSTPRSSAVVPYSEVQSQFEDFLRHRLAELFDPNQDFEQTPDQEQCVYCDFRSLCGR